MRQTPALLLLMLHITPCLAAEPLGGVVVDLDFGKAYGAASWPRDEANLVGALRLPQVLKDAGIQLALQKSMMWLPGEYRSRSGAHVVLGILPTVKRAHEEMIWHLARFAAGIGKQLPDGRVFGDVQFCSKNGGTILFVRRNAYVGVRTTWRGGHLDPEAASRIASALDRALAAAPKKLPEQRGPIPTIELRAPFPKRMVVGEEVNVELRIRSKANIVGVYSRLWKSDGGVIQASRIEKTRTAERFRVRAIRVGKATLEFLASDGNAMTGFLRVSTEVVPKPAP